MPNIGPTELIIILVIVLVVFGGSKLPKLARSLGEAKNEFEKTAKSDSDKPAKPAVEENVTMTKAEYDALLAQRDTATRKE